jgi:chaperonin cofactor prefoldin
LIDGTVLKKLIDRLSQQCNATIETLKSQMKELETKDKEKTFELEQLKNKIHQYTNREGM